MSRTASRSWTLLVERFSTSTHTVQACRSRQERAGPGVRTGRTAAVRSEHSALSQENPKSAHHIHKKPAIMKSSSINTPQVHQPAHTVITFRKATIRPNSRDGLLALKCGKSSVIIGITQDSAHDARIRQNSAARTCTKSKICAGTNARNKRDQRSLCGPSPVMRQAVPADQGQEEDSAVLLTTV